MADPDSDSKDYQWLVARERGDDVSHIAAAERAPYEALGAALASGRSPSAGWRARVLAAIDEADPAGSPAARAAAAAEAAAKAQAEAEAAAKAQAETAAKTAGATKAPVDEVAAAAAKRRRRWLAGGGIVIAAAAAVVLVPRFLRTEPASPPGIARLDIKLEEGPTMHRSASSGIANANIGAKYIVRAEVVGPAELRVYGGSAEKLIARCGDGAESAACKIERDGERRRILLEVSLDRPGKTHSVVFVGPNIPAPAGSIEQDLEAAAAANVAHQVSQTTTVR